MNRLLALILCLSIGWACGKGNEGKDAFLKGMMQNGGGQTLYLEQLTPAQMVPIDTAILDDDGNYHFEHEVTRKSYYRIKKDDRNFITVIAAPGEKIEVNGNWDNFTEGFTVSGSKDSELLEVLNNAMRKGFIKKDSLNNVYRNNVGNQELVIQLQQEFMAIEEDLKAFAKNMIDENPNSFALLAAVEQLNPDNDMDYYIKVDEGLAVDYQDSEFYQNFHTMVEGLKKLAVGAEVPDIVLPNPDGESVSLSSLRGKVVLIDFWASWCRPCRMENPNVVAAYNKYKDHGFEVFGVSLDKDKNSWIQAINDDQLHWTQVSDLKFWNSAVVPLYNIKGIPLALLIDEEGKILAKNLRGPQLEAKLEEVLMQ